MKTMQNLKKIV